MEIVEEQQPLKYLGITLDKGLTFLPHVKEIRKKAFAIKKLINPYINKTITVSQKLKILIYRAYIQSILLYAAPTWSAVAESYIRKIEAVENSYMRTILGLTRLEINNRQLHERINITPFRRKLHQISEKSFNKTVQRFENSRSIGDINRQTAPFTVRHRLVNHIVS